MKAAGIIGVGASSPLGFDARQTAFGIRAGKLSPRPCSLFVDRRGAKVAGARALGVPDDVLGVRRMVELGARALREAALDAGVSPDQPLRVFATVAERERPLPKEEEDLLAAKDFLPALERRSKQRIDGSGSEVLRLGHAGFAAALERALASAGSGPIAIGGVDTYHHPEIMRWLDRDLRLLTDSVFGGFVPSEGAAFVVVGGRDMPKGKPAFAKITHAMAGAERLAAGEPRIAALMTELVRQACGQSRSATVPWVLTDMNGERHRAKEWSFVTIRNKDLIVAGETRETHIGQIIGDAGAATGALAAAFATVAFRTGFTEAREAILALHSDGDERGVAVLEATS